jgi:hypothetical protein
VKGEPPTFYKEGPKSIGMEWPPRFVKVVHIFLPTDLRVLTLIVHLASHGRRIRTKYRAGFLRRPTSRAYTALYIALN